MSDLQATKTKLAELQAKDAYVTITYGDDLESEGTIKSLTGDYVELLDADDSVNFIPLSKITNINYDEESEDEETEEEVEEEAEIVEETEEVLQTSNPSVAREWAVKKSAKLLAAFILIAACAALLVWQVVV